MHWEKCGSICERKTKGLKESMNNIDYGIMKNCYATGWSYGEICVGCNCCGRIDKDKTKIFKARLRYAKEELYRLNHFKYWGDGLNIIKLQEKNIKIDKCYWHKEIKAIRNKLKGVKKCKRD